MTVKKTYLYNVWLCVSIFLLCVWKVPKIQSYGPNKTYSFYYILFTESMCAPQNIGLLNKTKMNRISIM